jgi:nucleoside-diphosphate-sugar epimerase
MAPAMVVNEVRMLVNTGTFCQDYQDADHGLVNLYAATKQAFEDVLQYYVEAKRLSVITPNLFDTSGFGGTRKKPIPLRRRLAEEGGSLAISPGDPLLDLVHVDDVVRAFELDRKRLLDEHIERHERHERHAVSNGAPISFNQLVSMVESSWSVKLNIECGGRPNR